VLHQLYFFASFAILGILSRHQDVHAMHHDRSDIE
jgi:hypothetical protein